MNHCSLKSGLTCYRTIHGMVYNAMKLFMEVNPQLFDDCSHEYTESQNNAEQRAQARQARWDKIAEMAKGVQNGTVKPPLPTSSPHGSKVTSPLQTNDTDPLSQESQRRLEQLKLGDEGTSPTERRPKENERQASSVR